MIKVERIVNQVFNSNTYILYKESENSVFLVDPGNTVEIYNWINDHSKNRIEGIFVTHSHFDHICAINDLLSTNNEIPVYLSANGGIDIIKNDRKNASRYHETPFVVDAKHFVEICDGDSISLWGTEFMKIVSTPGHSIDSITLICDNYFFTGDALIPNVKVVTKIRGGNKQQAAQSLDKIFELMTTKSILCPGHEKMVQCINLRRDFLYVEI